MRTPWVFHIDLLEHEDGMTRFIIVDHTNTAVYDSKDYCLKKEAGKYAADNTISLLEAIYSELESINAKI